MKKPRKPTRPKKPSEPNRLLSNRRTSREPYVSHDDVVDLDMFARAAEKLTCPIEAVNLELDVEYDWDSTIANFYWWTEAEVLDPAYEKNMKKYEAKMVKYNEKMKVYRRETKAYKALLKEWEEVQKAEELVRLKERLNELGG